MIKSTYKIFIAFIFCILIPGFAFGYPIVFNTQFIRVGSAVAYTCPGGVYTSYWDGDYDSDNDQICYDSGGSNKTGTNTGGAFSTSYGKDGSIGWRYSNDDTLLWDDSSAEDLVSKTSGTIWVQFRVGTTCPTSDLTIVYVPSDSAGNYIKLHIESDTPGEMRAYYRKDYTDYRVDSTSLITCDSIVWNTVGMSWRINSGDDISVTIGSSWDTGTTRQDRDHSAFTGDIDSMEIGTGTGQVKNVDFNRIVSLPGWEAACPW